MADAIAKAYGIRLIRYHIEAGFKYIGQKILNLRRRARAIPVWPGGELWRLIGTHARDKDAIVATMALAEAAALLQRPKGMTLWDAMLFSMRNHGYYKDAIKSIELKGMEGLAKIKEILETLRQESPKKIGSWTVQAVREYREDTVTDLATGAVHPTGLPTSNVLYYELDQDAWLCVRPSGTEPKVKFYYGVKGALLWQRQINYLKRKWEKQYFAMINKML